MDDTPKASESNLDKVARVITEAFIKARRTIEPELQAAKWSATTDYLENLEQEMAPAIAPLLSKYIDHPNTPEHIRDIFKLMAGPEHQFDTLLQIVGFIGAILVAIPRLGSIELQELVNQISSDYPHIPLSPADAADAVVRGIMDKETAANYALQSAIGPDVFEAMIGITGEPPGPMDMLSLWRRGIITKAELEQAIKFSRLKDQYIPWIEALAHSYISPADAIIMALKGVVDLPTAKEMWTIAGGLPEQFELMYEATGDAVGPEQAMALWNHGLITEAQVNEVLSRSRINPMFYDIAKLTRHKYLGIIQIEAAVKSGALDVATATSMLVKDGYDPKDAAIFAGALAAGGQAKHKGETESMVIQQYNDLLITSSEAESQLVDLGYDAATASAIIELSDAKRAMAQLNAAVGKIRSAYEAGHITRVAASNDIDKLGVRAEARDQWLLDWDVAKSAEAKTFTMVQVGSMAKKGIISYEYAGELWANMGYSEVQVKILRGEYADPSITLPVQ